MPIKPPPQWSSLQKAGAAIAVACALALPVPAEAMARFASAETQAYFHVRFSNAAGMDFAGPHSGGLELGSDQSPGWGSGQSPDYPVTHLDGENWTSVSPPDSFGIAYVIFGSNNYAHTYDPGPDDEWAGAYQWWTFAPLQFATLVNTGMEAVPVHMAVSAHVWAGFDFDGPGIGFAAIGYDLRADAPDGQLVDHRFNWEAYSYTAEDPYDMGVHSEHSRDDFVFSQSIWLEPGEAIHVYLQEYSTEINIELWPRAQAVPEPAAWMMLIVGFGLVGVAGRKRRRSAA